MRAGRGSHRPHFSSRGADTSGALALLPSPEQTTPPEWPAYTLLELGALPESVPCARTHARAMLTIWDLPELIDSVELLVAELTSNAVKYSRELSDPVRPPIRLRLSRDGERVLVEVWDASLLPPIPAPADFLAESGRGLHLVAAVSDKWGHHPAADGGKVVWAEVGQPTYG